jgi:hypothetical protein
MSTSTIFTKQWILLRYAVEISDQSTRPDLFGEHSVEGRTRRDVIDCSDGLLTLKLNSMRQLCVTRDHADNLECVDLLASQSSSPEGTYTGDSLLIHYGIPFDSVRRRFLVRFASTESQTARQLCSECVALLSRWIPVHCLDEISSSSSSTQYERNPAANLVSMTEMIKVLLADPMSISLSSYYDQPLTFDGNPNRALLEKFLIDETFPDFVGQVATILDSLKDQSKAGRH